MKILKKEQLNVQISENRRREIEQGLMLAKKVDALRNELLELQKQRVDFIEQTKLELEKEIGPLSKKLESIKKDILELGIQRTELRDKVKNILNIVN